MRAFFAWWAETLFHKQRKLFATGCTGLTLLGAFFYTSRHPEAGAAFKIFADSLVFVFGLYMAGNSSVYLWQSKFGTPAEKKP